MLNKLLSGFIPQIIGSLQPLEKTCIEMIDKIKVTENEQVIICIAPVGKKRELFATVSIIDKNTDTITRNIAFDNEEKKPKTYYKVKELIINLLNNF